MNEQWRKFAAKIDTLSLRERAMVFAAVVAAVLFIMNASFIDPLTTRTKTLSARMAQQQTALQALQAQILALEQKRADPDAANLARRDAIRRQIGEIDAILKEMQSGLVSAQGMKAVLQEMLVRSPRLQLIAMRTLPVTPLIEKQAKAEKSGVPPAAPQAKPGAGEGGVYKHGVQITIQGGYADLHDYLARLERQPWRMYWSRASLNADDYPRVILTVTIYTLSLDKAWLMV